METRTHSGIDTGLNAAFRVRVAGSVVARQMEGVAMTTRAKRGERPICVAPGSAPRGMLLASIGFRVQPHKRDEVLSAADETVRRMRTTSGCARSRLLFDADDPNAFVLISEWHSADTANGFFTSRDFRVFKGIRILLRDEPVIVFDEVQTRVVRLLRAS